MNDRAVPEFAFFYFVADIKAKQTLEAIIMKSLKVTLFLCSMIALPLSIPILLAQPQTPQNQETETTKNQPDKKSNQETDSTNQSEENKTESKPEAENKKDEGIINLIIRGGWTMLGLGLISTIILAFSIERYFYFKRKNLNTRGFNEKLKEMLSDSDVENIVNELEKDKSLISQIAHYGLKHHDMGLDEVERSLEKRTNIEIGKLERGLNLLANFGNLAPLLGFFGTVVGMRESFLQFVIQKAPTAQDLAGGVEEALITTAAGLLVAIPTYLIYNLFIYKIDHIGTEIEEAASLMHDHLKVKPGAKSIKKVSKKVK